MLRQTRQYPLLCTQQLANICGLYHENIAFIETTLNVRFLFFDYTIVITGASNDAVETGALIVDTLYSLAKAPISLAKVKEIIYEKGSIKTMSVVKLSRKTIEARNAKQACYLESLVDHEIVFAVGPAGTGKTYLAVSKAIESFERGEVQRLVFVRPAVEAGEKLGFLPGDLVEKVLPYLRPIYDALYEMIGFKETQKLIQSDVIEVLPLAFMRGRTLNEAFIILDEAQNTTVMQMKMFLTRMGFGSKVVITGDMTQVDLPKGTVSGLQHAVHILKDIEAISIHHFSSQEVVRNPLITRIVDCYDLPAKKKDS